MIVYYSDGVSFHVRSEGTKLIVLAINFENRVHIVRDLSPADKAELKRRIQKHVADVHQCLMPALEEALT